MTKIPHIAILGRPNVGKSTLFNRLIGRRKAIVDSVPGITRDRIEGEFEWNGVHYRVSDLAGWDESPENPFAEETIDQIRRIALTADILLIVVDAKDGPTEWDRMIIEKIRATDRPIIIVVNKCDTHESTNLINEFYELGLGDPFPVSATHNINVAELVEKIESITMASEPPMIRDDTDPESDEEDEELEEESEGIRIALVGRQNVGKSTLFNALVGDHRAIVSNIPGTTRDAIDIAMEIDGRKYIFIDTAGLKKRSRTYEDVDYYAARRTEDALKRSDVALLLIDCSDGVLDTDRKIAGIVQESTRACVIIASKWDQSEDAPEHREMFERHVRKRLHFLDHAPLCFTSGLHNQGIENILPQVHNVWLEFNRKISTSTWNKSLIDAVTFRPPPTVKGKLLKMNYITQTRTAPPTLTIFVNHPEFLRDTYKRYLENYFRKQFGFEGSPLIINIRKKHVSSPSPLSK
jgi:GTP-binding protein